jgi:MinD-like ATPase involved in chromosome partitioning or flagellar assembly
VLLDLGAGLVSPVANFAARRADQLVLVTTSERVPSAAALDALALLRQRARTTAVINRARDRSAIPLELCLLAERPHGVVTVPHDEQLATMLETGTYTLGALGTRTRTAIKRLGVVVTELLV